jgi:hypothetical protein
VTGSSSIVSISFKPFSIRSAARKENLFHRKLSLKSNVRRTDTSHAVAITPVLHSYLPLSLNGFKFLITNFRTFPYDITSYLSGSNSGSIFYWNRRKKDLI